MKLTSAVVVTMGVFVGHSAEAQTIPGGIDTLVQRLEVTVASGDPSRYLALMAPEGDREQALEFARQQIRSGITRATFRPRAWTPLEDVVPGEPFGLIVEALIETGPAARVVTWELALVDPDLESPAAAARAGPEWSIVTQSQLTLVDGLYHLTLDSQSQFTAEDLVIASQDLELTLERGTVFFARNLEGVTAAVLLGEGQMVFEPAPEAERGQVRIFSGENVLRTRFREAFVRLNPADLTSRLSMSALTEGPVVSEDLRRATDVFQRFINETFSIELGDLSDEPWSLAPARGDFLANVETRRFGALTYSQSGNSDEDIWVFDAENERTISWYASPDKLAARGFYYDEDAGTRYDVLDYQIEASFEPRGTARGSLIARPVLRGCWIEGRATLRIRPRGEPLSDLTLRLAGELEVRSIGSPRFGPLLHFRQAGVDNVIIYLPVVLPEGSVLTLEVAYGGLLPGQTLDENLLGHERPGMPRGALEAMLSHGSGAPKYLYSNRSYWYPQSTVTDSATATMRLTVPSDLGVVASGDMTEVASAGAEQRRYTFLARQPVRYLASVISEFVGQTTPQSSVTLDPGAMAAVSRSGPGTFYSGVALSVATNPSHREDLERLSEQTAEIVRFYASLVGDVPFATFTLAVTDSFLPGGHSPAYFAMLNRPLPRYAHLASWRNDPVNIGSSSFFLAHEVAHQWWGQAIGVKNYHERWLSEGLAQYFAALNEQRENGDEAFLDVVERMHRWAMRSSDEGPIYLGFRLGHLEEDVRVFRALVYNKAALVLHMLRRLIGDDVFFEGLRRFYGERRFTKAGTDDLRRAFEAEAGVSLERFFERWIHDTALPRLVFSYGTQQRDVAAATQTRGGAQESRAAVLLRFEQTQEEIFDVPVTVTLRYRSGRSESLVVNVTDRVTEVRAPLSGQLRRVEVNEDRAALAEIDR